MTATGTRLPWEDSLGVFRGLPTEGLRRCALVPPVPLSPVLSCAAPSLATAHDACTHIQRAREREREIDLPRVT